MITDARIRIKFDGKELSIREWSKLSGKTYDYILNLYHAKNKGRDVTLEQVLGFKPYKYLPPKPEKKIDADKITFNLRQRFLSTPLVRS